MSTDCFGEAMAMLNICEGSDILSIDEEMLLKQNPARCDQI
jgi:hypothetical protein